MKLKNKKTGVITDCIYGHDGLICVDAWEGECVIYTYGSLAELNEEWEDYEEPKGNWTIDPINEDCIDDGRYTTPDELERYEELGLKFDTKEEAEKAVERLKAWKRLKDKGFKFGRWQFLDDRSGVWVQGNLVPDIVDELDILFGGEE